MLHANQRHEYSGAEQQATNNTMELTAAIEALRHTPPEFSLVLHCDSRYVVDGMNRWIHNWKRKGWRKADGKPVLNLDLWKTLDGLAQQRHVTWKWVEGHSGDPENERCDALANQARLGLGD